VNIIITSLIVLSMMLSPIKLESGEITNKSVIINNVRKIENSVDFEKINRDAIIEINAIERKIDFEKINRDAIITIRIAEQKNSKKLYHIVILEKYFCNSKSVKHVFKKLSAKTRTKLIIKIIIELSKMHKMDSNLVLAVAKTESHFNPNAKSRAGAIGVMQLMKATAKLMRVKDIYNPIENIEGGIKYLKYLKNRYGGNETRMLAAYNAGPGVVEKYNGVPPYNETKRFIKRVTNYRKKIINGSI